jgi:hypothetical protein
MANNSYLGDYAMPYVSTLNGVNSSLIAIAPRRPFNVAMPRFAQIRAAMPSMPPAGSPVTEVAGVAGRFALALVPFGALAWMFIAY